MLSPPPPCSGVGFPRLSSSSSSPPPTPPRFSSVVFPPMHNHIVMRLAARAALKKWDRGYHHQGAIRKATSPATLQVPPAPRLRPIHPEIDLLDFCMLPASLMSLPSTATPRPSPAPTLRPTHMKTDSTPAFMLPPSLVSLSTPPHAPRLKPTTNDCTPPPFSLPSAAPQAATIGLWLEARPQAALRETCLLAPSVF